MEATDEYSEVVYTDAIISEASHAFARNFFATRFGRLLILACVVNVAGFAVLVWLGLSDRFVLFALGTIVLLGVAYVAAIYFYFPRKATAALKKRLKPSARITITPSTFEIATADRGLKLPWSELKRIVEYADYFILVFKPSLAFTFIPKQGLSAASQEMIREASTRLPVRS